MAHVRDELIGSPSTLHFGDSGQSIYLEYIKYQQREFFKADEFFFKYVFLILLQKSPKENKA